MNELLGKLKDIKPPVAINDVSWWWLMLLASLVVILIWGGYLYWKYWYIPKPSTDDHDPKTVARQRLKSIDYSKTKEAVYRFSEDLPLLLDGDEEAMAAFEALQERLARHKYKKEVPPLSKEEKEAMRKLIAKGLRHG